MKQEIPTYYDLAYSNSSRIFEADEVKDMNPTQLFEAEKAYNTIVEKLEKGEDLDEGFLTGLAGLGIGALLGPTISRAICNVLGIDQNGTLGKLMCSRLVTSALGYTLGK